MLTGTLLYLLRMERLAAIFSNDFLVAVMAS